MVTTNLTATPSPEAPGAGAVAHMSLHLKPTMSKSHQRTTEMAKRSGQPAYPDLVIPGDCCPFLLATGAFEPFERRSRPVKGPLSLHLDSVNRLFAILFQLAAKALKSAVS